MNRYLLILSLFLASFISVRAQTSCAVPSNTNVTSYPAYCYGTGKLRVNSVSGGSGTYQYALYDSANSNQIRPFGTIDSFTNLTAGTYNIHIRSVCGTIVSADYVRNVVVANAYLPLYGGVYQGYAECNDGYLGAQYGYYVSNGYRGITGSYRFSLVNALNAQETPGNYIRPIQTSPLFTGLTSGTYFYRIYDDCNNYVTYATTVNQINYTSIPFGIYRIREYGCDTIQMDFAFYNYGFDSIRAARNAYIVDYNDGTKDTLKLTNVNSYFLPVSRFDSTKTYTLRFVSTCGTTLSQDFKLPQSLLTNDSLGVYTSALNCDSFYAYLGPTPAYIPGSGLVPTNEHILPYQITYSFDSGATWTTRGTGRAFAVRKKQGSTQYQIRAVVCGDTIIRNYSYVEPAPYYYKYESNIHSCDGRTGFYIGYNTFTNPVTIRVLSAPAGQDTTGMNGVPMPIQEGNEIVTQPFRSILPGKYVFRLQDACGRTVLDSMTLTKPKGPVYYTAFEPYKNPECNKPATGLRIRIGDSTNTQDYYNYGLDYVLKVYDATGTLVRTANSAYPGYKTDLYFNLDNLTAGTYTFKVSEATGNGFNDTEPDCGTDDTTYTYQVNGGNVPFSLSQSLSVSCINNMAAVVGNVAGGRSPYVYSLFQNAYTPANQIAGPQVSNVFDSLSSNAVYVLRATDSCGTGILYNSSFQPYQPQVFTYGSIYPCINDSITLLVPYVSGARYQWKKNGQPVAGATTNALHYNSFAATDYGQYVAEVWFDSCLSESSVFDAVPANCGVALSVHIASFQAGFENCKKTIRWSVEADEPIEADIERSVDGIRFATLRRTTEKSGLLEDAEAGSTWYRLKLTSATGTTTYSAAAKVSGDCNQQAPVYQLYPVPATTTFRIQGLSGQTLVEIFSAEGRLVQAGFVRQAEDHVDISALGSGTYLVRINQQQTLPLVIRK